ncbi:uncharacterized protein LOC116002606 [Ipomoea triloba]|uniref:uncharacterized protein LOC116002606 n=1 Tax=Ipomoea triloba TaxID=35885 RepID=UPI00125D0359|nr:uncharacterized protein LOC116002606 [Ipomoea triloba]
MALARDGKIELTDATASSNQISCGMFAPLLEEDGEKDVGKQCKRSLPFIVKHTGGQHSKPPQVDSVYERDWVLVTRRKQRNDVGPVRPLKIMTKRWIKKKPARELVFDVKKKGHPNKPRTLVTLAQYRPKVFHQHGTDILGASLNTKEKHVEVGECSFPMVEGSDEIQVHKATSFTTEITFKDEDLLLGGTPHNRPLFVEGYAREQKIKRILIDQGSSVNILSRRAVKELGISIDELSQSRLMIQGFNQGGQRALCIIRLDLRIGSLSSSTLCYVIDARTSYNMLLGRPWIHENGVVPSSWHQCLMFEKGGVIEKVVGDEIPFTEAESYFADAKFYLKKQVVEDDVDKSSNDTPPDPKWKGFDPKEPQKLGRLIPEAGGRGKSNQQEPHARKGLGYVPPKPVRIFINRATSNCITSADEEEGDKRQSVFDRIGKAESRQSVFNRLGSGPRPAKRKSVHDRIGPTQVPKKSTSSPTEIEPSKRLRSTVPSRMRRENDIQVSCGENLKVQPKTIVHTRVQNAKEGNIDIICEVTSSQYELASSFHITLCDETPIEGEDAEEAPHELEEGVRAAIDELKEVDLGTPENPRPIFISTLLFNEDEKIYVELLKEYIDVFTWTYKEMPGIVPVRKKNGQIRVCVDFRDLNVACPQDDFPLPITELLIDAVTRHEIMSFMDGSSGYNQIRMAPEDEELTAFRTPNGIYCYKVMPFGLKNAGATYQRAM